MGKCNRSDYKHFYYNPERLRIKSREKDKKAVEWYIDLLKKEQKLGMNTRIMKTKTQATARLKKYGITPAMVQNKITSKGLTSLPPLPAHFNG